MNLNFEEVKEVFRWRTMEGETLNLNQMKTSHIFNCLKMVFNHVAHVYGGTPVRFTRQWHNYFEMAQRHPQKLAYICWIFHMELQERDDMIFADKWSYKKIMDQILQSNWKEAAECGQTSIGGAEVKRLRGRVLVIGPGTDPDDIKDWIDDTIGDKHGLHPMDDPMNPDSPNFGEFDDEDEHGPW